jgi:hypothetical protein
MSALDAIRHTPRRLQAWVRENPWFVALVVIWTVELWWVQSLTTRPTLWSATDMVIKDKLFRFLFDLLGIALVVRLLPRLLLYPLLVWNLVFYFTLLSYFRQYDRGISIFTILTQGSEGAQVLGAAIALTQHELTLLVPLLLLKGWLIGRVKARGPAGAPARPALSFRAVALVAATWLGLFAGVYLDHKPIWRIGKWESVAGIGHTYGYVPAWLGELIFIKRENVYKRAMERFLVASDKLGGVEVPVPIRRNLVFIQVESLDEKAIGFEIGGRPVTPELTALRERSMYYRIQAQKFTGSCDSDFTALMGRLSSLDFTPYRIEGLPWDVALPHDLNRGNFETSSFHGVSGDFFHRRDAFPRMGFDRIWFKEELAHDGGYDVRKWTLADSEVFDFASAKLAEPGERKFAIVITATSHMPFRFETPGMERVFFPNSETYSENYFDAIHYVDHAVGSFVSRLPPDTTAVIYGDHWSTVQNPSVGYEQEVIDGFAPVPFYVYNVGEDLSKLQKTRGSPLALSAQLSLLDMMTWVHRAARASALPPATLPSLVPPAAAGEPPHHVPASAPAPASNLMNRTASHP